MAGPMTPQELQIRRENALKLQLQRQGGTQQLQLQREEAERRGQIEAEKARALNAAAVERQKQQDAIAQQQAQQEAARGNEAAQHKFEYEQSQRPFSQRHPQITQALPWMGMAGAFASPYLFRIAKQFYNNGVVREWRDAVDAAEKLLGTTKAATGAAAPAKRAAALTELQNYAAKLPTSQAHAGFLPGAIASTLPAEFNIMPTAMDAFTLDPGNPAREKARAELADPREWMMRIPQALGGATMAGLGSHLPIPVPPAIAPAARTAGLSAALGAMPKKAPATKKPPGGKGFAPPMEPPPMPPAAPQGAPQMPPNDMLGFQRMIPSSAGYNAPMQGRFNATLPSVDFQRRPMPY